MTILQRIGQIERDAATERKAITFLRFAIARAATGEVSSGGGNQAAAAYFKSRWPLSGHTEIITKNFSAKAVVAAASTTNSGALAPLREFSDGFIEYLRPLTVIGRMQEAMRPVPFNVRFPRVTAGTSAGWIGQGRPVRLSRAQLEHAQFGISKIGGMCVISKELARLSDPAAEALIRADLTGAAAAFMDEAFLDPSLDEVEDVSPASITFGATGISSTGSDAAAVEADMTSLFAAVTTNMLAPFLVMRITTALALARLRTTTGDRLFPNIGALGGDIWGVPVIVSGNVPQGFDSPATNLIVLIDAAEVLLGAADISLDLSEVATVQMDDDPDHPVDASTTMISLWQHNLVALKFTRFIRWARRRENSVAYISGVPF